MLKVLSKPTGLGLSTLYLLLRRSFGVLFNATWICGDMMRLRWFVGAALCVGTVGMSPAWATTCDEAVAKCQIEGTGKDRIVAVRSQ